MGMPPAIPFKSQDDMDAFLQQITKAALNWVRPIWWYDWRQPFEALKITGASCFVLKFETRYVGVTAAHVLNELFATRRHTASLDIRLQLTPLNLLNAVIETNDDLDIATFAVSEQQVGDSGVQPFDVSLQWPPDIPVEREMPIHLVGFPEALRFIDYTNGSVNSHAYQTLGLVEHVTDRDIFTIYDPEQSRGSPALPPLGFNMSGCSGGPAILHHMRNGIHRMYPVGLITGGPFGQGEGVAASFDMIRITRINCIDPDGRIQAANMGWLPSTAVRRTK
jgi:hypothetical protein